MGLVVATVVVLLAALVMVASAQRRADQAERRTEAVAERNRRLERALGVAEQALRAVATDSRTEPALAVQVDAALEDVRRAAEGRPGLSG